ncbi:adenylate cyclase Ecym_8286 [Eremothecium cymbalariae DBVPG|uniref:Adenylate cyclase n=1 Tax=Eremothecium cymbalariae (strain CBS 270.75 / DBVPG 7215 / KCTC 17166 / NRRL Y-17582) TaxID=931890 RepID=G8JXJ2_ERECY|nr:Hypothetical protein Ecym_8286 [Eremothecium cymbalariae DBVPG\
MSSSDNNHGERGEDDWRQNIGANQENVSISSGSAVVPFKEHYTLGVGASTDDAWSNSSDNVGDDVSKESSKEQHRAHYYGADGQESQDGQDGQHGSSSVPKGGDSVVEGSSHLRHYRGLHHATFSRTSQYPTSPLANQIKASEKKNSELPSVHIPTPAVYVNSSPSLDILNERSVEGSRKSNDSGLSQPVTMRKTPSRAGSFFKRLTGRQASLNGVETATSTDADGGCSTVMHSSLRRKMNTFIYGNEPKRDTKSGSVSLPGSIASRRSSATSGASSSPANVLQELPRSSISNSKTTSPTATTHSNVSSTAALMSSHTADVNDTPNIPHSSNGESEISSGQDYLSRNPTFFNLNIDLNNLSDITSAFQSNSDPIGSNSVSSRQTGFKSDKISSACQIHGHTSPGDLHSKHNAQWTAPESWDIDDQVLKSNKQKQKCQNPNHHRHHHRHRHQYQSRTPNLVSSPGPQEGSSSTNMGALRSPIHTADTQSKSQSRTTSIRSPIQRAMSPISVISSESIASSHSGSCEMSVGSTAEGSMKDSKVMRSDSTNSFTTVGTELNDAEDDNAQFRLEKYYNDMSDIDYQKRYAIRIFNTDDTFTTLSCTPDTTVGDMIPQIKRKFNVTQGNFQVSLKVGKMSKVLRPTAKPILIQLRLLLLNGYKKTDPLNIMGIEDLSFVFSFIFHPVITSQLAYEQEQRLIKGEFVHIDLRSMDLTLPPIIFYQHMSDIESIDVSNNANIFLPLDFIESVIKLSSLRMVNIRASKFPANICEANKLVSLDLERNFISKVPDSISKLSNLTMLNLKCNELEKLPRGFKDLKNLQLLEISSNKFNAYPEVINKCTNLLQINLSYNKIKSIPLSINQLTKLAKINLSNNRITTLGDLSGMKNLRTLNLRCNRIESIKCRAPNLQNLFLTDNRLSVFDDDLIMIRSLELQENPITFLSLKSNYLQNMASLSINKAKLSSLPGDLLQRMPRLEKLEINENNLTTLPPEIKYVKKLVHLSVVKNKLESLPEELSQLKNLKMLDVHCNNLLLLPYGTSSLPLTYMNVSSNLLSGSADIYRDIFQPTSNLSRSLMFFSAADNQMGDKFWELMNNLKALKVLNLSYNNFMSLPELDMENLTELYLSGNHLSTLSGDAFLKLKSLKVLMLNGNNLQSLPVEISQLPQLAVIDIGSNQLKYNISNYHYDWNWRQNTDLKYLNFSGNTRFEIKSAIDAETKADLSDLTILKKLRVLGLMDVTLNTSKVPDDGVNFRLRTMGSRINGMEYGVADTLGQKDAVSTRDVTFERFRGREDECLICLYDGVNDDTNTGHKISQVVRDIYDRILLRSLEKYGDKTSSEIRDALRFSFLQLNKEINSAITSVDNRNNDSVSLTSADSLSGASVTVVYMKGKKIYTANIGNTTAILSKGNGEYGILTHKHVPTKTEEFERIRISGGYVNNKKLNSVSEISRAVGFFDLLPHVHASPDITESVLTYTDDMLIIATHSLLEYLSHEKVSDVARENKSQPMLAAERMKDYAIAYGCTENITILCVSFNKNVSKQRQFSLNKSDLLGRRINFEESSLRRLQPEIPPPTGHLAIVFTDIKNSTVLWELFPNAMRIAIKAHNDIMRRKLRIFGGYEVKTEGDAFMVAFPTPTSALVWCLTIQLKLLDIQWPEEITSIKSGCMITDDEGTTIYQGLSVRMGIHWGYPVPEIDIVTQRMDYLGPMVNKAARVSSIADGGQITLSSDFIAEFNKIMRYHKMVVEEKKLLKEVYGEEFIGEVLEREIQMLENIGWVFEELGEQKLKGLETREFITISYPKSLAARNTIANKEQSNSIVNDDYMLQLRTISNTLENILSSVNGGLIEIDNRSQQAPDYVARQKAADITSININAETDWISSLDHLVTRLESTVAILQLNQRMEGGLEIYRPGNKTKKSVFELLDQLWPPDKSVHP